MRPREERFWEKVEKTDGCWRWLGATTKGYGQFWDNKRSPAKAHRVAYEMCVGPIPEGLHIDHLCCNPICVNPEHLEPVTNRENVQRGFRRRPRRAHCSKGHPLAGDNLLLYEYSYGTYRTCRKCNAERVRLYTQRKKEVAA